ncbi:MAG: UPF0182 family protein [Minisyncoccia bacterium]|jgi:uncharacterized membrane protein (UPF0182 family)
MLGFLMFLTWFVLSIPPLGRAVWKLIKLYRDEDRDEEPLKRAYRSLGLTILWAVLVIVGLWALAWLMDLRVESLWFADAGYAGRFWTQFNTELVLYWIGFVLAGAFCFTNVTMIAKLNAGSKTAQRVILGVGGALSLIAANVFGSVAEGIWQRLLLFLNGQPFGKLDPVFSKDVGFYVFTMPFIDGLTSFAYWLIGLTMIACFAFYAVRYGVAKAGSCNNYDFGASKRAELAEQAGVVLNHGLSHVSALGILFLLDLAVDTFLDRYKILYSTHGNVYGAGWTDLNVRIPAYWGFMIVLAIGIAFLATSVLSKSHRHTVKNAIFGFGGTLLFWLLAVVITPAIFQSAYVSPNELQVERPFIQREIDYTSAAYGLDRIKPLDFPVKDGLTRANLTQDAETLESARLWDWRVLLATNHQLQAFKPYYSFKDVDVVRYDVHGKKVQVLYSGRELDVEKLPESAKTWQNMHLVYTHGFGGTANPVNDFTSDGLPDYWVKDLPPVSRYPELEMKQPRIYFGEATTNHVYVNTHMQEYDYPVGDGNAWFQYDGPAGIPLGGFFRRLSIAWKFDGFWRTWSEQLGPESRILFNRDIATRTEKLVPFLWHEEDTYQVIADGQLWFMRDFNSVTEWYPYSAPHNGVNYMRNSVKSVTNAYTGKTDFYVFEPNDPVIRTYQAIFPGLFKPMSQMPASLRKHVRYPQGLLEVQGDMYAWYHMKDATAFYNKEDMWQYAKQFSPSINKPAQVEAYYLVMSLPDRHSPEYVLVLPFTPKSTDAEHQRNNLESWLAARCDGDHYGELMLYRFPTTKQVQGPLQVGIRMNQDETLSKDFSLWNQQGSKVVLGDMRVLPLSDHRLLNVQAIYLESEGAKMPQLKYVVAASGDQMVYEKTFSAALERLIGAGPTLMPPPATITAVSVPASLDLTQEILGRLDKYFGLLQQGKFSEAGNELQAIRDERAKMKSTKK